MALPTYAASFTVFDLFIHERLFPDSVSETECHPVRRGLLRDSSFSVFSDNRNGADVLMGETSQIMGQS